MKIAVFTDIYAPWSNGGIASSVKAQKDELEKLGHEVYVFCPGSRPHEKNVITVPSYKHLRVNGAVVAKKPQEVEEFVLEKFPNFEVFDVVHVHYEGGCSVAGINLARKFRVPLVQTMHGREDMAIAVNVPHPWKTVVARAINFIHGKFLPHIVRVKKDKYQAPTWVRAKMWEMMVNHANQADIVITPTDHFGRKLEHYGVEAPVRVVSNAVGKDLFEEGVSERKLEDGAVLKMVWNSRVSREKRIMPFLRAVKQLKRPYLLYVYGDGNDLKEAKKFAQENNLKVKFFGRRPRKQIMQRMQEAHLGIMASYNFDTQGMTLLEAEATGLPVFFCDPEMIEVVPEGSYVLAGGPEAPAMAIAIEKMPAEKIAKMSRQMLKHRDKVKQSYQIKKILSAYTEAKKINSERIKNASKET